MLLKSAGEKIVSDMRADRVAVVRVGVYECKGQHSIVLYRSHQCLRDKLRHSRNTCLEETSPRPRHTCIVRLVLAASSVESEDKFEDMNGTVSADIPQQVVQPCEACNSH